MLKSRTKVHHHQSKQQKKVTKQRSAQPHLNKLKHISAIHTTPQQTKIYSKQQQQPTALINIKTLFTQTNTLHTSPEIWTSFSNHNKTYTNSFDHQPLPHQQLTHTNNNNITNNNNAIKHFNNNAFRQTKPQHFIGRILAVAGVLSIGFGARYIARGGSAFVQAYKDTKDNLKPVDETQMKEAADEIANAARDVMDKAHEEDQLDEQCQEKMRTKEYEKEHPKQPTGPTFYQDDMSMHIDKAAIERKQREEEEAALNVQRYISNEEEILMNEMIQKWELVFAGDGDGFAEEMTLIEAERILQCTPNPCLEELKERRAIMMRLNHPDLQGSPFLASKVNEAFEKLALTAKSDPNWTVMRQKQKEEELQRRIDTLKQFETERLKKEGKLDNEGDFVHPDGTTSKRYDNSDNKETKK